MSLFVPIKICCQINEKKKIVRGTKYKYKKKTNSSPKANEQKLREILFVSQKKKADLKIVVPS